MQEAQRRAPTAPEELLFGAEEVSRRVPHRPPMLLLDGIVALREGERCTSVRRVRPDEHFLSGHFPGDPIVPGIYLIENIAQTACFLAQREEAEPGSIPVLVRVERCTFSAPVSPPADLLTEVQLVRKLDSLSIFQGVCRVDGRVICRAEMIVGRAPRGPAATTERRPS